MEREERKFGKETRWWLGNEEDSRVTHKPLEIHSEEIAEGEGEIKGGLARSKFRMHTHKR